MLELNSPLWEQLDGPYGQAGNVPRLLGQLQEKYAEDVKDELYWEDLFHQNTIYSATLAAVPHLADIAKLTDDPEIRLDIYIACGQFEADRGSENEHGMPAELQPLIGVLGPDICRELYGSYRKAVAELASYETEVIAYAAAAGKDLTEKRYAISASAAYRGWRNAARVLSTYVEGDEYVLACADCGEDIYVWPSEDGEKLAAYASDPVFEPDQAPGPVSPGPLAEGSELAVLRKLASDIGETLLARQIPYLSGHANCPSCGKNVPIWAGLTGEPT